MDYINTKTYREDLASLTQTNNDISDTNLDEQTRRYNELNADILQSLQLLVNDYPDLLNIESHNDSEPRVIDFEQLGGKIMEFNSIITSLRMIYLEQESLDNFLRYTISSGSRELPVTSIDDPVLLELEREVEELENTTIESRQDELAGVKGEISAQSRQLFNDDCLIKELCVETSETIDECQELLDEIEAVQETRKESEAHQNRDMEKKVNKTYETWQDIMQLQERNALVMKDITTSQKTLASEPPSGQKGIPTNPEWVELNTKFAIQKFMETHLLPTFANVHDFTIDYPLKRINFSCGSHTITLTLTTQCALESVQITDDDDLLAKKVQETFTGESNIYRVIHYISTNM